MAKKACLPKFLQNALKTAELTPASLNAFVKNNFIALKQGDSLASLLIKEKKLDKRTAEIIETAYKTKMSDLIKEGQAQFGKRFEDKAGKVKLTKAGRKAKEKLQELAKAGIFETAQYENAIAKNLGIPVITEKLRTNIENNFKRLDQEKDPEKAKYIEALIQRDILTIQNPNLGATLRSYTVGNLLNRASVAVFNVGANVANLMSKLTADQIASGLAYFGGKLGAPKAKIKSRNALTAIKALEIPVAIVNKVLHDVTKGQIPLLLKGGQLTPLQKTFLKEFTKAISEIAEDIDTTRLSDSENLKEYLSGFARTQLKRLAEEDWREAGWSLKGAWKGFNTARNNALYIQQKTLDYLLNPADRAFRAVFEQIDLENQMLQANTKQPTYEMVKKAKRNAMAGSFQQESVAATVAENLQRFLTKAQMPFARVPANALITNAIEYSPVKLIGTVYDIIETSRGEKLINWGASKKDPILKEWYEIYQDLGKAGLGTLSMSFGYHGVLLGFMEAGELWDRAKAYLEAEREEQTGLKVGTKEDIESGKAYEISKIAMPSMIVGAYMAKVQQKKIEAGIATQENFWDVPSFIEGVKYYIDSVGLGNAGRSSFAKGIGKAFKEQQGEKDSQVVKKVTAEVVSNLVSLLTPASGELREVSKLINKPTIFQTYSEDPLTEQANKFSANFFAGIGLKKRSDLFGEEVKDNRGFAQKIGLAGIVNFENVRRSPELDELSKVQKATSKGVLTPIPKSVKNTRTDESEIVTGEQYYKLEKTVGVTRKTALKTLFELEEYKELSAEQKRILIKRTENLVHEYSKGAVLGKDFVDISKIDFQFMQAVKNKNEMALEVFYRNILRTKGTNELTEIQKDIRAQILFEEEEN